MKYGPEVEYGNAKTWEKRKTSTGAKQLCPFVNEPLKDCFCREMNTHKNILAAINNCLGNYKECQIYVSQIKLQTEGH